MFKRSLFWKYWRDHTNYFKIVLSQTTFDDSYDGLTQLPLLRVILGHLRSDAFLSLTFDRSEMEQGGWFECISLAVTHGLVCNMTYLGHDVTSSKSGLRSNFYLDFPRSTCMYFDASRREEHDEVRIILLAFSVQIFQRKHLCPLTFDDLWWPQHGPGRKINWSSFEMIFEQFLNVSFLFLATTPRAELDGGGGRWRLDAPPPGRPRKFRSTSPARVNILLSPYKACSKPLNILESL